MQHTALAEVCRTGETAQYSSQLITANRPKLMQTYTKHLCKYTQSNNANICIEYSYKIVPKECCKCKCHKISCKYFHLKFLHILILIYWLMAKFLERIQSRQAGARELIFWELLATWIISKLLIQNWDKTSIWVMSVSKEAIHPDHLAVLLNQDHTTGAKNYPDVLIMTKRSWAPKLS